MKIIVLARVGHIASATAYAAIPKRLLGSATIIEPEDGERWELEIANRAAFMRLVARDLAIVNTETVRD